MIYDRAPFAAHLDGLEKELKKQAFWKTALFGVVLLERQWPVYERLALGREWGAAKEVRKVLDRLWKGIPTGMRIGDNFWMLLEDNPVEPVTEAWDPVAALTVDGCLRLMEIFREKDKKAAGELAERNLKFLGQALSVCGEEGNFTHPLFQAELDFQTALCARLCQVPNSEKTEFVNTCKGETVDSIMGDLWFPDYPDHKPLKRKAKKAGEIRYSHIRYDEWFAKLREKDENGLDAWDHIKERLQQNDTWLNWQEKWPNDYPAQQSGRFAPDVARRWPMPEGLADFYGCESLSLYLDAEHCYGCRENAELTRGLLWLAARSQEACYSLLERGWPCSDWLDHRNSMTKNLIVPAAYAICAGDWKLAEHLLARYHKPIKLRTNTARWLFPWDTRVWLAIVQGDDEKAAFLMEQGTRSKRPPTKDEQLWPHLYPWYGWENACKEFRMLLDRDTAGLRKQILSGVRGMRSSYEQMCSTLGYYQIALLKLARRRGMELDLPRVVEIPDGIWEDVPLDGEKWKLPGQAVLDRALGPDGDKLLAQWKKLAEEKMK